MNAVKFILKTYVRILRSGETVPWNFLERMGNYNIETDDEPLLAPPRDAYANARDKSDSFNIWNGTPRNIVDDVANKMESSIDDKIDDEDHYNLDLIADIFDCTEVERRALNVALYLRHKLRSGNKISSFLDRVTPGFSAHDYDMQRIGFGFSFSDIENLKTGSLYASGLLVPSPGEEYFALPDSIGDIFQIQGLTVDILKERLFKTDLISTLSDEAFDHLKKEIVVVESIVRNSLANKSRGTNIFLWGEPGTGKTELPFVLAKKNGWNIISVGDTNRENDKEHSRSDRLVNLRLAQKIFSKNDKVVLLFDEFEDVANLDNKNSKAFINRLLETTEIPIFWTTNSIQYIDKASLRRMTYNINFKLPTAEVRQRIWRDYANQYSVSLEDSYIEKISEQHEMSPSLIHNAMRIISSPDIGKEYIPQIIESINTLVNYGVNPEKQNFKSHAVDTYSTKFVNANMDINHLAEMMIEAKRNFSLCLYGPAGTGKSEYGKYLAHRMGKKILYKRASDLKSMWQGETEKLIAGAFEEASESGKILLIDEGDTFLQDRQMARQHHEVAQVNEMLSQMEMLKCNFILTTNLMNNLDPAAFRRFIFKINFDFLEANQVKDIFKHYFGVEAPEGIRHLDKLTPGDFAAVKEKIEILGTTDAGEIFKMMKDEMSHKEENGGKMRIGF